MEIWSNVEYVFLCLKDKKRTIAFKTAIEAIVKPGDVVIDLGTGTGILALFAAAAGASKVYAIEIAPYLFQIAKENFNINHISSIIECVQMDARDFGKDLAIKPDVVVWEMVTSGLISEMQVPVFRALQHKGMISSSTKLIPQTLITNIELVEADFNYYGFEVKTPLFINYFFDDKEGMYRTISNKEVLSVIDFSKEFSDSIERTIDINVSRKGSLNGILLSSITQFKEGMTLDGCISYCQPVILPIERLDVDKGDKVRLSIKYNMGHGFDGLSYSYKRITT